MQVLSKTEVKKGGWVGKFFWHRITSSRITVRLLYRKLWRLPLKKFKFLFMSLLVFNLIVLSGCNQSNSNSDKKIAELKVYVNEATMLINQNANNALTLLAQKDSKWQNGETYIFVMDKLGKMLVHPDKKLVNTNVLKIKDVNGKPIFEWFIKELKNKESDWSHYLWVKPNEIFPTWKSTYLMSSKNKEYIVGSGVYNLPMTKDFVVDEVDGAAAMIKASGPNGFSVLRDIAGEYRYMETYVFVLDEKGVLLVDPPFPTLEGRNLYSYKDESGKQLFKEFIDVAKRDGSGWVDYMWPHPGSGQPVKKTSYIKKVMYGDTMYIVGTGIYKK
jgi:signal transduction histidine kinase